MDIILKPWLCFDIPYTTRAIFKVVQDMMDSTNTSTAF